MLAQKVGAGVHQRHRIERAAPEMGRGRSVRRHPFKVECRLDIGERAEVEQAAETFGMPGDGGVDIVEQPLAHHKGFAGSALFAGTAVETHRAAPAVLRHPRFQRERRRQSGGAEQVMAAAVAVAVLFQRLRPRAARPLAEPGQRVELAENGDHRPAFARAGDKGGLNIADAARHGETFLLQRVGQQRAGARFGEAGFRRVPDSVAKGGKARLMGVDIVGQEVSVHRPPPNCA